MDDELKGIFAYAIASFIGCLAALLVFGAIALLVSPLFVNAGVEQAKNALLSELRGVSITCSEAYMPNSTPVNVFGRPQFCKVEQRSETPVDSLDVNISQP